jgi:Integrase zinc binding domain
MAEPSPTKKRQDARRAASSKSKPYSKTIKSISPSSSEESEILLPTIEATLDRSETSSEVSKDQPGFPTHAQYKRIESIYLNSLSPRKRDKALITQAMFDNIWDVLHDPDTREIETAQFRFWVRKMFALSDPQPTQILTATDSATTISSVPVVLHENRPVAIREQLYELFVYCHARSNHGGRDKTCAVIRQHYSWVPKELTAQFVKACPTCTLKRSGNPDLMAMVQEQGQVVNNATASSDEKVGSTPIGPYFGPGPNEPVVGGRQAVTTVAALDKVYQDQSLSGDPKKQNWPPSKGSLDTLTTSLLHRDLSPMLVDVSPPVNTPSARRPFMVPPRGLKQPPAMSREISLFNGIPHGWTIDDPESIQARAEAYNTMVEQRTGIAALLPPGMVPRIPSVVFKPNALFTPDAEGLLPLQRTQIDEDDMSAGPRITLPPLMQGLEDGTLSGEEPVLRTQVDSGNLLPLSLQPLKVSTSQALGNKFIVYVPEIDPSLLDKYGHGSSGRTDLEPADDAGIMTMPANTPVANISSINDKSNTPLPADMPTISPNPVKPALIRRTAAPAPLELTSFRTTNSNFTSHRNTDDSSPTTPDSANSCYSQLSLQVGSTTSTDPSPFATALPTPIDEHQKTAMETAMELAAETDGLVLGVKDISEVIDIGHPWEQEAEFPTMMNLAQASSEGVLL